VFPEPPFLLGTVHREFLSSRVSFPACLSPLTLVSGFGLRIGF